jgi:hypothetical protein
MAAKGGGRGLQARDDSRWGPGARGAQRSGRPSAQTPVRTLTAPDAAPGAALDAYPGNDPCVAPAWTPARTPAAPNAAPGADPDTSPARRRHGPLGGLRWIQAAHNATPGGSWR